MSESHFLKRLELNGFKSFAGKTVLEFPAGIVAVVGPNGSGKSNIVDAVRWLLGERDAKNLRGARVEDLIFAGTQKRARVGMAQASLYFENKNKFFPVDFEEVVVSRQISRDGASKYYLNKSEILLRDLIDFLAKARLGSKGMIIIGQGDSDLFIRSTPLERREAIEEMLGLREYQIKKTDAERRLKNSKINLDKVTALIEEIEPHLRSLKRQTSRWERRGALEEELRSLENQFFGSQLHELRAKSEQVESRIAGQLVGSDGDEARSGGVHGLSDVADVCRAGIQPVRAAALNPGLGNSQLFADGFESDHCAPPVTGLGTAAPEGGTAAGGAAGLGAGGLRATV